MLGIGGEGLTTERVFCCEERFYILIEVVVTGLYVFINAHRTICQTR